MEKLQCDICGGSIVMQSGGKVAVCDSCGMQYSTDRIREKVQEIRSTVRVEGAVQARQTGTEDDVAQWRSLVSKYYKAGDFPAAEQVVKKILEALPADEQANRLYDELQVLKYMEIKNGILVKYTGMAESVSIPECVEVLGEECFFKHAQLKHLVIPGTVKKMMKNAFAECKNLETVIVRDGVTAIGPYAFSRSRNLKSVILPDSVTEIGFGAFAATALRSISIPPSVTTIGGYAFSGCTELQSIKLPAGVTSVGSGVFRDCDSLVSVEIPERFCTDEVFMESAGYLKSEYTVSPWYKERLAQREAEKRRAEYRKNGLCQYCGGGFSIFTKKCVNCGRKRDY